MINKLNFKLKQAEFFISKLEITEDVFERECYFSAYLAALKSVWYYIQTWMLKNSKISNKSVFWKRVDNWTNKKCTRDEATKWKCISNVRNTDIHEEPVTPEELVSNSYWPIGYWAKGYWPDNYWPALKELKITDPKTNKTYSLIDTCKVSIDITRRLIKVYKTM